MGQKHLSQIFGVVFLLSSLSCGTNSSDPNGAIDPSLPPKIKSITPGSAKTSGGEVVSIQGENFISGITVSFDEQAAEDIDLVSSTEIKVLVPKRIGIQGNVPVKLTNHTSHGALSDTATELFAYYPSLMQFGSILSVQGMVPTLVATSLNMTGDGRPSLIASQTNSQTNDTELSVFLYNSVTKQFVGTSFYSTKEVPTVMSKAFLNTDNKEDLLVGLSSGKILLFFNNGAGSFVPPITLVPAITGAVKFLTPVDYNKDGNMDIGVMVDNYLGFIHNNGDGTFALLKMGFAGNTPTFPAMIDYNHDGWLDFLVISNARTYLLQGNPDGTFQTASGMSEIASPKAFVVSDFNNDKKADLLVVKDNGGVIESSIWFEHGGAFQAKDSLPFVEIPKNMIATDLNGDSILDLIITGESMMFAHLGNGDGTFQAPTYFSSPAKSSLVTIGDLDLDTKPDILVYYLDGMNPTLGLVPNTSQ